MVILFSQPHGNKLFNNDLTGGRIGPGAKIDPEPLEVSAKLRESSIDV
jgi:hypothetical protein